jgi:aldose 1-epimerase
MAFTVTTRPGTAGDRSGPVYVLASDDCRAEVWPFAGFNCLRWQVRTPDGWADLLYVAPDWETNPVPTRSGHPVLFPFPNRLRDGKLSFGGKEYVLPLNDSVKRNAIHGFAPRVPWRVVGTTATATDASVTGQFRLSQDAPESAHLWPADATLTLTYRLTPTSLRVEALVENPGPGPLPFGLGYHPYFRVPGATADESSLTTAATSVWETDDGVPTGRKLPLPPDLDFRASRPVGATAIDNLFGDLDTSADPFPRVAVLRAAAGDLAIHADPAFGELVLFTPVHRQAVAVEPYTCATDAAHLEARGVKAGWRELPAGGTFVATTEYRWASGKPSKSV